MIGNDVMSRMTNAMRDREMTEKVDPGPRMIGSDMMSRMTNAMRDREMTEEKNHPLVRQLSRLTLV